MSAYEHWSEKNDTCSSCQVWSNHLYMYVCLRAVVIMECYITFLPSVITSLVQACLPESVGQIEW